jgi:GAF domain-containing protein
MSDDSPLRESLAALSQFFVGDRTMEESLHRVAEMTKEAVPAAAYVGVTMMHRGRPQTTVFTDPAAPEIDARQYEADSGPCLDSFRLGEVVRLDSARHETRWPEFRRGCLDHGILSTISFPLTVENVTNGALNLYAKRERAFSDEEVEVGGLFAAQAAIVLANAQAYWSARAKSEQLEQALQSRAEIEQAKGIIMAATRCTPDEAFDVLVRQSQQQNRKLRDIAIEIVSNASRRV